MTATTTRLGELVHELRVAEQGNTSARETYNRGSKTPQGTELLREYRRVQAIFEAAMAAVIATDPRGAAVGGLVVELLAAHELSAEMAEMDAGDRDYLVDLLERLRLSHLLVPTTDDSADGSDGAATGQLVDVRHPRDLWNVAESFAEKAAAWRLGRQISDAWSHFWDHRRRYGSEADFFEALRSNWRYQKFAGWAVAYGVYTQAVAEAMEKAGDGADINSIAHAITCEFRRLALARADWLDERICEVVRELGSASSGPRMRAFASLSEELRGSLASFIQLRVAT